MKLTNGSKILSVKFVLFVLFSGRVLAAQTVPSQYQSLSNSLSTTIQSFAGEVNTGWNQSIGPMAESAQLGSASDVVGSSNILNPLYYSDIVIPELNELKALGVKAVVVIIDFPMLYPGFYSSSPSAYQSYLNFYTQLSEAIHARGMKMIVGTGAAWSSGVFAVPNVTAYYASLTLNQYIAERTAQAVTIATVIHPDFMTVVCEPDTEASETGISQLGNLTTSTALLTSMVSAIHKAGVTGLKIGGGTGSWMPSWQSWIQSFAAAGEDYFDIHVFPIAGTYLTQLPAMANYAASLGKPIASTQFWLSKESASEVTTISYGQVAYLEAFSFWSPLDLTFLQNMVHFGYWKNALFMSPFWEEYFFATLPYNSTTAAMSQAQIISTAQTTANQAIQAAQYDSEGLAYGQLVTNPPHTTPPTVPTGLTTAAGPTTANLNWAASTDNVGVAGYSVSRNGIVIATTPLTTYYDTGLTPSTVYTYAVSAYDGAERRSGSAYLNVTTLK